MSCSEDSNSHFNGEPVDRSNQCFILSSVPLLFNPSPQCSSQSDAREANPQSAPSSNPLPKTVPHSTVARLLPNLQPIAQVGFRMQKGKNLLKERFHGNTGSGALGEM
ncbi:hypothetical protein BaRGS_00039096 [Batillaria attramentaria]|uniref:Uncharacterized protein n=1 Tax=Batillaria attramentaria TaxID=370345 RepID=A0ABD0J446_9CAEN